MTRPPRTRTTECSWRLCPSPGMYAQTSLLLLSRTRATLRSAELGFRGVWVETRRQTPRRCGHRSRSGDFVFCRFAARPLRTSCWMVGISAPCRRLSRLCRFPTPPRAPAARSPGSRPVRVQCVRTETHLPREGLPRGGTPFAQKGPDSNMISGAVNRRESPESAGPGAPRRPPRAQARKACRRSPGRPEGYTSRSGSPPFPGPSGPAISPDSLSTGAGTGSGSGNGRSSSTSTPSEWI